MIISNALDVTDMVIELSIVVKILDQMSMMVGSHIFPKLSIIFSVLIYGKIS